MDYSPEVVRRFVAMTTLGQASSRAGSVPGVSLPSVETFCASPSPSFKGESNVPLLVVEAEAEDRTLNVWVHFRVGVSQGAVVAVEPQVFGCPHTIAAASWAADWLRGGPAERLRQLDVQAMRRALEVPTEKLGKLLRIEDALAGCWARLEDSAGEGARKEG